METRCKENIFSGMDGKKERMKESIRKQKKESIRNIKLTENVGRSADPQSKYIPGVTRGASKEEIYSIISPKYFF